MSSRWPTLVALGAGVLVLAATVLSALATEPDSAFSGRGDASALVEEAVAQDLETLRLLSGPRAFSTSPDQDPERTLLVLVAPERPYRDEEAAAVHAFLEEGGSVLVADNFGHGNSVTTPLGFTFERVRLVEGEEVVSVTLGARELSLRVVAPTALHVDPGTAHTVLASSSGNSFLDRDGDGLVSASEPPGPFPVLVETAVGAGRLVVLSDPTILSADADAGEADGASGADAGDNAAFREAILAHLLPEGGRVVVDESRSPSSDPWLATAAALVGTATSDPWRYVVAVLSVLFLLAGVLLALDAWGPHRFDVDRFVRRADLAKPDPATADPHEPAGTTVQWTRRGRAALAGGLVLAVLGLALGNRQATYAAALLLLGGALAVWAPPVRVRAVRRVGTDRLHEEGRTDVELDLDVSGRGGRVEVLDALAPEFELVEGDNWFQTTLRPRKPVQVTYRVRGALRGPHAVGPLRVRASDPFGLRTVERTVHETHEVLVLPRNDPLSRIPFRSRVAMLTLGPHLVNRAGDGTEFHALRDYQRGDSVRMVNWKASARSDGLVVNQRVHESMATIAVFLDARAVTGAGAVRTNPLNEGCRAAMSIVTGALQARDKVRLFVYGDGVRELCPDAGRSKAHEVSEALAGLEARGDTTFLEAVRETLPEVRPSSPFVLVTGTEGDDTLVEGLRLLRQRNAQPFVLALEIGTGSDGEAEPDAERLRRARQDAIRSIQSTGTPVLPAVPGMPLGTLFQVGMR